MKAYVNWTKAVANHLFDIFSAFCCCLIFFCCLNTKVCSVTVISDHMFSLRVVKVLQVQESRSANAKLTHGYELEPFSVFLLHV